jgi:hypothetical protein
MQVEGPTHGSTLSGIGRVVQIILLDEAQERFEAEDRWWREHRDSKELFVTDRPGVLVEGGGQRCR